MLSRTTVDYQSRFIDSRVSTYTVDATLNGGASVFGGASCPTTFDNKFPTPEAWYNAAGAVLTKTQGSVGTNYWYIKSSTPTVQGVVEVFKNTHRFASVGSCYINSAATQRAGTLISYSYPTAGTKFTYEISGVPTGQPTRQPTQRVSHMLCC